MSSDINEQAAQLDAGATIWELCTCDGEGCIGCDPNYLETCAKARAER